MSLDFLREICQCVLSVFLNTFCVAIEHYGQPIWLSDFLRKNESFCLIYILVLTKFNFLDTAESVFLIFFIFETVVRMWALGYHIYFESSFNRYTIYYTSTMNNMNRYRYNRVDINVIQTLCR